MKKTMAVLLAMVIILPLMPFAAFAEDSASGVCGEGVTWRVETTFVSNRDKLTISGTGRMDDFSESSPPPWEVHKDRIGTVIIDPGVSYIGAYAFYHCSYLDYVIFRGNTPPEIAEKAFSEGGGEGIIAYPEGQEGAYADILTDTGVPDTWSAREPYHARAMPITGVKIPVAGEYPDYMSFIWDWEEYDEYYSVSAAWWDPNDEEGGGGFDRPYEEGDDYHLILELTHDFDLTGIYGGVIDYKNGLLPLDGFTVNGQPAEFYTGGGPGEISMRDDLMIMVTFRSTADFVPVTDIRGVPLDAAVEHPHTLSGTVIPDNATYKDIVWRIKDAGGTGAVLAGDGKTITSLTNAGIVTVTATVLFGGAKIPDPDNPGDWLYQNYTEDFEITVTAPAAPTISGPAGMILTQGYAATVTGTFTVTGSPTPDVSIAGDPRITWNNTYKRLEIAAGLLPGEYPVTLTVSNVIGSGEALPFMLTVSPQGSGAVTGKIGYEHNNPPVIPPGDIDPKLDVVVSLWQNDALVETAETMTLDFDVDAVRYYSFTDVDDGWYTVVAKSYTGEISEEDLFYTITRDVYVKNGDMVDRPEPIIFTPGKTQSILEIADDVEARNVATNDLPDLFEMVSGEYNPQFTCDDREHLETGGEVEFKLDVKKVAAGDQSLLTGKIAADGYSGVLFVDLTLTKTLSDTNDAVVGEPIPIPDVAPALLEIAVPMTSQQTITAVYRIHENEAPAALPNGKPNEVDEYFLYDAVKNTVYLYVNRFSAYAFAVGTGREASGVPQTGDAGDIGLWVILPIVSVLGLASIAAQRKKQTGRGTR